VTGLLCVNVFASTFSIGGFAPLLPEIGRALRLSDPELGMLAGIFGLARMASDVPAGLFVRRHLEGALILGPLVLMGGIACVATSDSLWALLLGRVLMGMGHSLGMVAGLTAVLHVHAGGRLGAALNSTEFAGMLGLLGGLTVVGWLPRAFAWNSAFVLACAPVLLVLLTLPALVAALRGGSLVVGARGGAASERTAPVGSAAVVVLVFAIGATFSCAYSTIEQFLIPLRGSRHFGLDRGGIAFLLQVAQLADIAALLPLGVLADRRGAARVLVGVAVVMATAMALIAFGPLSLVAVGCGLLGLAMAGWMLPLSVLREVTAPEHIAVRTAFYRVGVDGGMFLGPFLTGLASAWHPGLMPALLTALLVAVGLMLAHGSRRLAEARAEGY
jgi:MFS family permease